jgi:transposase
MTDGTLSQDSGSRNVLYIAIELSSAGWIVAFSDGSARKARRKRVDACDLDALEREISTARGKLGLGDDCELVSCYEAGRDGFWLDRALSDRGVCNYVVDASSILVDRRQRRAKTDALDVESLLRMLVRFHRGERDVWRTVHVPSAENEDARRVPRERERLKKEVTQVRNRIFGLLATQGLKVEPERLKEFLANAPCSRDGRLLGSSLVAELSRMLERHALLLKQLKAIDDAQMQNLREMAATKDTRIEKVARLMCLAGIGVQGAWILVMEFFGWRQFRNRREVGALAGLTGTPYNSGNGVREQGISKAGNKRIRRLAVELAWLWLRYQPESALTKWFLARWGNQGTRSKKVGVVALARKLLVALWHYIEYGLIPTGAKMSPSRGVPAKMIAAVQGAEPRHGARNSARIEGAKATAVPGLVQDFAVA